jgi:hypothetical protein
LSLPSGRVNGTTTATKTLEAQFVAKPRNGSFAPKRYCPIVRKSSVASRSAILNSFQHVLVVNYRDKSASSSLISDQLLATSKHRLRPGVKWRKRSGLRRDQYSREALREGEREKAEMHELHLFIYYGEYMVLLTGSRVIPILKLSTN